ncbi:glycosyltransferase family 2 protein [Cyathus striatus]|nr:glycosyltransferase family 2 protein [Cyathus striatus]
MSSNSERVILITGGHGFIGSHVARRLFKLSQNDSTMRIRIVDTAPCPTIDGRLCHEFIQGDLCDVAVCKSVVRNVSTILHFAANMGGMGTIHQKNDFVIFRENHSMTFNLLEAAAQSFVQKFFYASSACVYPEYLQSDPNVDVSLREYDVFSPNHMPKPQHLYGCEKLVSELILEQYGANMDIRIARFHNIFGPGGSWHDGREKAPAAMLRKAVALSLMPCLSHCKFEIWGDGMQRRSFLYIDDAVDGIIALLNSNCSTPVNIGSDRSVAIKDLAEIALRCVGIDPDKVSLQFVGDKPIGVSSRNSNNDFVHQVIGWQPTVSLEDGMAQTRGYIEDEMKALLDRGHLKPDDFMQSKVLCFDSEVTKFAILLPITSRSSQGPESCLESLRTFACSLYNTTWRDTRSTGEARLEVRIYLAIDHDDEFLLTGRAQDVLLQEKITCITTIICDVPRGHVCSLWRECALRAYVDGCHYMVLMGDDVKLHDEGWMRHAVEQFKKMTTENRAPFGIGCVAFTDITFPGMPTFPIIHRTHLDIFKGEVVPRSFINQDGDPFLFQLYRRWGCAVMFQSRISNGVGGEGQARYEKVSAKDWTFEVLDNAINTVDEWLRVQGCNVERKVTVDIVIPCYRVFMPVLDKILSLQSSDSCSVMFIIIVDDPSSQTTELLNLKYSSRADVRIRVNTTNMGASYSRNRGMKESSADWVHFLDDDVVPDDMLLYHDEKIIRSHPKAAGFVGKTIFPIADTVFTTAVHLAGVTYFWDIATKMDVDIPWGVTANLIVRRIRDGVEFDLIFPKTGGGEDIDFCRKKRDSIIQAGGEGFVAAPDVVALHPWWNHGSRSYWRFYNWSLGDGALIKLYPQHRYHDYVPNSSELILVGAMGLGFALLTCNLRILFASIDFFIAVVVANVLHDCYRHLWRDCCRTKAINTNVQGIYWVASVIESSYIRMFSEIGRMIGIIQRREWDCIGRRFDWFTGRYGCGPMNEERMNNVQRFCLAFLMFLFYLCASLT